MQLLGDDIFPSDEMLQDLQHPGANLAEKGITPKASLEILGIIYPTQ